MAKRVVVVGGGFVGLSCAMLLQRAGHAVTLLEAQAVANEQRLQQKARAAEARETERRAAQATLMEMRRQADAELAYEKEAHRRRHIATRADGDLRALSRSYTDAQLLHRERARSAARLVRSVSAVVDAAEV